MVEDTLRDDETTSERSPTLLPLLLDTFQHMFQAIHVVVVVPADSATRDLKALLNSKVDAPICHNHVATLAECRNNGTDGRETLRIQDCRFGTEEIGDILLELNVNICCTVGVSSAALQERMWHRAYNE